MICKCAIIFSVCIFAQTSFCVRLLELSIQALSTMVADSCVFDSLKRLGVAGRPLDKNEERDVGKLAECGKLLMQEAVYDLLKKSQHKPVLFEYGGDATPLKLKHAFQVAFAEHHRHARSGYTGVELYCQGAFVRSIDASGQPVVQALLK